MFEDIGDITKPRMGIFLNIRADQYFERHSNMMLKVLDMMAMRQGAPQRSYEDITQEEFMKIGVNLYPFYAKVTGQAQVQQPATTQQ
jgi:hypothetical protein